MHRILLISISLVISSINMEFVFADLGCGITDVLPTTEEFRSAVTLCTEARENGNANGITEFVCPQGDFFEENHQPINSNTLPYIIAVNLAFNKTDTDIKKYMLALQKSREADPIMWVANIRDCTDTIATIYHKMCEFGIIESVLNGDDPKDKIITSIDTYPQELCQNRAKAKIQGWYYLETILMADSINKNHQNSTNSWISDIKWAYGRVLGAFGDYQRILSRAVAKMNFYIKKSN